MNTGTLLTIAIPTYNRATYLDACLQQICEPFKKFDDRLELIVSDNNSDDSTDSIVKKYIALGLKIKYLKNSCNIGFDGNFTRCYNESTGKYLLILGDDDILLDEALEYIIAIIEGGDYGVVYLASYGFVENFNIEKPKYFKNDFSIYNDKIKFLKKVNYNLTFISGNIINKTVVPASLNLNEFYGTNLVHLSWILSALFNSDKNVYINRYLVAAKMDNTGGYRLCEVFGINLVKIFNILIEHNYIAKESIHIIVNKLLISFFPYHILRIRIRKTNFLHENFYEILYPSFNKYLAFWVYAVPVIKLPIALARIWHLGVRVLNKLMIYLGK